MNIESHRRAIRESLELINESIQRGLEERQRTIGFHCSVAAVDMLELFLHSNGIIDPGKTIKHDFFTSERKALEKLTFSFEKKHEIVKLPVELESRRNSLCYGRPMPRQ